MAPTLSNVSAPDVMKGTNRRVWLSDEQLAALHRISANTNLNQTEIIRQILGAGLECISNDNDRITLPLHFTLSSPHTLMRLEDRPRPKK